MQESSKDIRVDLTAEERKKDHITLAFESQIDRGELDHRFNYEPILSSHPTEKFNLGLKFCGKNLKNPIWVSSMTGGTKMARTINRNLAKACGEFGMGMGLGSCRSLLNSDEFLEDFAVRSWIGDDYPLYANLGIAQIEELINLKAIEKIDELIFKLQADGLIIHVNPFQEWLQPEGDIIQSPPIESIQRIIEEKTYPLIIKEVGQGMGPDSLSALLELPLEAIEFAASGGTNFSKLELQRDTQERRDLYNKLIRVGHTAAEMVAFINELADQNSGEHKCSQVIISGGVKDFLDGYYLVNKCRIKSVYGQASGFLKYAQGNYDELRSYVKSQIEGYKLASCYLQVKD
jgi:isopentenyl-diphosphate delta-isomerase